MLRVEYLLLLMTTMSLAATDRNDTEIFDLAGREFFGELIAKIQCGAQDEVFDHIYNKWNYFYPGSITAEDFRVLLPWKLYGTYQNETTVALKRVKEEFLQRYESLNSEAKFFFVDLEDAYRKLRSKAHTLNDILHQSNKFDIISTKLANMTVLARSKLERVFPVFGKLDELKAFYTVAGRLIKSFVRICKDLPGYRGCDVLNAVSVYRKGSAVKSCTRTEAAKFGYLCYHNFAPASKL
ncbi:hypothetical protein PRIPAC_70500 [Pristionchus pacificus]|uniref:Uncharacterized protein n=1 Tax=Pristionchus pacificus TaxID=54126 RepID=A0A2A6C152_PRIPA|nr:hypothetical protein PRIPAC_70500 [Pristionchus pacificus]|eukprot:PDM71838.1 hypothetical protein PRIPAC_38245 [Pristionchus pacificus]